MLHFQVDLEDEDSLAASTAAIRGINGSAAVVRTQRCAVDVGRLLNQSAYSGSGVASVGGGSDTADARGAGVNAAQHDLHVSGHVARGDGASSGEDAHAAAAHGQHRHYAEHGDGEAVSDQQHALAGHGGHLHARRVTSATLHSQRPLSLDRYRNLHRVLDAGIYFFCDYSHIPAVLRA